MQAKKGTLYGKAAFGGALMGTGPPHHQKPGT